MYTDWYWLSSYSNEDCSLGAHLDQNSVKGGIELLIMASRKTLNIIYPCLFVMT